MSTVLGRGLLAGAVGTAAINATTYADMALRGRDASSAPDDVVDALAGALGRQVPGDRRTRPNRRSALGALSGTVVGVGVGVAASAARAAGLRFSAPVGAVVVGGAAMAGSDVPMALLGVSDPRTWTAADWVSDAVPHLVYGAAVQSSLRTLDPGPRPARRARPGLVARSLLLGVASGARGSLGFAAPALTSRPTPSRPTSSAGRPSRIGAALGVVGELVVDKLPSTPSRLAAAGTSSRFTASTVGATALARREASNAVVPVFAAGAGAAAGTWGGAAWRRWAAKRVPDWQAALVEDAVAIALAAWACAGGRRHDG